jgi:hypothetical protein
LNQSLVTVIDIIDVLHTHSRTGKDKHCQFWMRFVFLRLMHFWFSCEGGVGSREWGVGNIMDYHCLPLCSSFCQDVFDMFFDGVGCDE